MNTNHGRMQTSSWFAGVKNTFSEIVTTIKILRNLKPTITDMQLLKIFSEKDAYKKQYAHRIQALVDGVFAIVITLLVLDIRIMPGEVHNETDVRRSLLQTIPQIFTFILSFSVVGLFWLVFSNQFNYIHIADRSENIIALFFLMSVCIFPFTASFLSEHLWSKVAVGLYVANILLAMVMNIVHWLYCYYSGLVKAEGGTEVVVHKGIIRRELFAISTHVIVAIVCFFSSPLALGLTFILQAFFTFVGFAEQLFSRLRKNELKSSEVKS